MSKEQLPQEWLNYIEEQANDYVEETRGRKGRIETYIAGATAYALRAYEAERERDQSMADFKRVQESAIHYANRKDEVEKQRDTIKANADKAISLLEKLVSDALLQIANGAVPSNEREMASWIMTARQIANQSLSAYEGKKEGEG